MTPRSLGTALAAGTFAITAEVTPPLSCDPADLLAKAAPLKGLVEAVNVTSRRHSDQHGKKKYYTSSPRTQSISRHTYSTMSPVFRLSGSMSQV